MVVILRSLFILILAFSFSSAEAQSSASKRDQRKLRKYLIKELPQQKYVLKHPKKYRLEIVYGEQNNGLIKWFQLGKPRLYYYPASLVKLPLAVKTLEWLQHKGISSGMLLKDIQFELLEDSVCHQFIGQPASHLFIKTEKACSGKDIAFEYRKYLTESEFHALFGSKVSFPADTIVQITDHEHPLSLEQVLQDMLVFSDNRMYNLLFQAIAAETGNTDDYLQVIRPFVYCEEKIECSGAQWKVLNETWERSAQGSPVSTCKECDQRKTIVGKQQVISETETLKKGRDFSTHNQLPLKNMAELMRELTRSSTENKIAPDHLSDGLRLQLIRLLSMLPQDVHISTRASHLEVSPGYTNFLSDQTDNASDNHCNIIGQAYGFTSDVLCYTDTTQQMQFYLAVRLYTNANQTLNDDTYEYNEIAFPFMRDVFKAIRKWNQAKGIKANN